MKSYNILALLCVLALSSLQGCAGKILPYDDTFECPQADKGQCTNVAGAYKIALKDDPESAYSQKANTGKAGKREMENLLEVYQLAVQSEDTDAVIMRGEPLLKILKEQEAPSATKLANEYADTSNLTTKKRILARASKTVAALLASNKEQEVAPYDPYLGLPPLPSISTNGTIVLPDGSPSDVSASAPSPFGQGAPSAPPANSVELYVAPYNTGFGAQAGGRTLFISEGVVVLTDSAAQSNPTKSRNKQEIGTVNHPE